MIMRFLKKVQFSDGCDFQNAEFCDIIYFDSCECRGGTGFTGGKLNFAGANVELKMKLRAFRGPVNFRSTNFVKRPPELFGSDETRQRSSIHFVRETQSRSHQHLRRPVPTCGAVGEVGREEAFCLC